MIWKYRSVSAYGCNVPDTNTIVDLPAPAVMVMISACAIMVLGWIESQRHVLTHPSQPDCAVSSTPITPEPRLNIRIGKKPWRSFASAFITLCEVVLLIYREIERGQPF